MARARILVTDPAGKPGTQVVVQLREKGWPVLAAVVGVGVLAVIGFGVATAQGTLSRPALSPDVAASDRPRPVKVVRVVPDTTTANQSYTGVVKARYETDLGFRVGGKVTARLVEVGDAVRAGQPLARLDPADYDLAVKAAEAELTAAQATARNAASEDDRFQRIGFGATSQSEVDRARDTRKSAAARVDQLTRAVSLARNRLGYCALVAEADGLVMALSAEVGQVVTDGQTVIRLARIPEREAVVNIPENRVAEARTSTARAALWSAAGPGYPAVLRELSPNADPATRTYRARFTLRPTTGEEVPLGRTVTVHLASPSATARFALPLSSLTQQGKTPAVWRVDGDRLTLLAVTVAEYRDETVVVTDGVKAGDVVVAAGVQKLDAGLRVRPWEGTR